MRCWPRGGRRGTASVPEAWRWATDEGPEGHGRAPRHPEAVARGSSVGKGPFGAYRIMLLHGAGFVVTSGGFPQYEAAARAAQADAIRRLWGEAAGGWGAGHAAGLTEDEAIAAELEGPDLAMEW